MAVPQPSDAEKAMGANADSRRRQGAHQDRVGRQADQDEARQQGEPRDDRPRDEGAAHPPASTDLLGPGGDPVEGKP